MDISLKVLRECMSAGVQEFIVCAGARNAPLVHSLSELRHAKVYSFFEERSAAYFALGRMQRTQKPVAVITTSGTAVANLLPATVEAFYQGLPLLLITADRPREYRGTAAPQAIDQVGIFSNYVERVIDLADLEERATLSTWSRTRPLQFNVCFDEPLIDRHVSRDEIEGVSERLAEQAIEVTQNLATLFEDLADPLAVVGPLRPEQRTFVKSFLQKTGLPFFAESLSGLSHLPGNLTAGEDLIKWGFRKKIFKSVLRIGGVPTFRFWRDLEVAFGETPVGHLTANQFTGLSRQTLAPLNILNSPLESLTDSLSNVVFGSPLEIIFEKNRQLSKAKGEVLQLHPCSEPSMIQSLAQGLDSRSHIYLGNSLPIREWDFANLALPFEDYYGNRGANGIDGQVSSFLGWSESQRPSWGIFGDLTALYDLASLWITPQIQEGCRRVVVINNGGGQIFNRMFQNDVFLNRHKIQFNNWAEMFSWKYLKVNEHFSAEVFENCSDQRVIEVIPDEKITAQFWAQWERASKEILNS